MPDPVPRRPLLSMATPWFALRGFLFIPATLPGWIIVAGAMGYAIYAFIAIDSRSHSVSDTMINFVFRLLLLMLAVTFIAWLTSRKDNRSPQ